MLDRVIYKARLKPSMAGCGEVRHQRIYAGSLHTAIILEKVYSRPSVFQAFHAL